MARKAKPTDTEAAAETGQEPQAGASVAPAETKGAAPAITVIGPKEGRRRAGRRFGAEPVTIPLAELSEAEIAALRADALLNVSDAAD